MVSMLTACSSVQSLSKAVERGDVKKVEKAIADGINLNQQDKSGQVPLVSAIKNNQRGIALILAESDVSFTATNTIGENALDVTNDAGDTLLHFALLENNDTVSIKSLEAGASLDVMNKDGKSPLTIAEDNENYIFLYRAYAGMNDFDKVIQYGDLTLGKDANDTAAMWFLAKAYVEKGNQFDAVSNWIESIASYETALYHCNEILEIKPNSAYTMEVKKAVEEVLPVVQQKLADYEEQKRKEEEERQRAAAQARQSQSSQSQGSSSSSGPRSANGRTIRVSDTVGIYFFISPIATGEVVAINGSKVQVYWSYVSSEGAGLGYTKGSRSWKNASDLSVTSSAY